MTNQSSHNYPLAHLSFLHQPVLHTVCLLFLISCACVSADGSGEDFDYFENSWCVIGLKDYAHGTRISPANELMIGNSPGQGQAEKQTVRLRFGRDLGLLSREQTKRLLDGWLPIILLSSEDGWVHYEYTLWATPLPNAKDWQAAYNWPTEGENYLNWILIRATNTGTVEADGHVRVESCLSEKTAGSTLSPLFVPQEANWKLAPGESAEFVVRIPWEPVNDATLFDKEDPHLWLERTAQAWRDILSHATAIDVPCWKARQALLASHVYQLITNDHGEVHGGEGFYDEFYIRDGAYQIMQYEEAGLADVAQLAIKSFLSHQREDGRFESQKGQFDANGQDLWALWQYYQMTGDKAWLENAWPQIKKSVDWIQRGRKEAETESPFAGLLPQAPADGEYLWDGKHHIVGYDFWNLRGLLCAAQVAQILEKAQEAEQLDKEVEEYRAAIDTAWTRTGLPYFPPSWEKEGTHWGNTEILWPTPIYKVDDPRIAALSEEVRSRHGGGFREGTICWLGMNDTKPPVPPGDAIHPYMSAYTTMNSLRQNQSEQVVEDFYWYLLHSTATHGFPEGIFHKRRFAWSDTLPHATGASNFAILLRHMLIDERGDELHLMPAIPDWWLEEGREIRIEHAPTHFGEISLHVKGASQGVSLEWEKPVRKPPLRVVVYLPGSRPLLQPVEGIEVVTRDNQSRRWDFPTVVDLYEKLSH